MRSDAKKNLTKVAKEAIKDPLANGTEIAAKTGVSVATAYNKLEELRKENLIEKNSDVIRIAKTDLEHLELIQGIEFAHLQEYAEKANTGEFFKPGDLHALASIAEKKQKRHSILMGENTNPDGGEKEISVINYGDIK